MTQAPGGSRIRKLILDKVKLLGTTEHQEIFALLQVHGIAHSSNSNGIFINLSVVPDDTLAIVKAFVDYCAANKKELDAYDKRLQECKITQKFDLISVVGTSNSQITDTQGAIIETEQQVNTCLDEHVIQQPPPIPEEDESMIVPTDLDVMLSVNLRPADPIIPSMPVVVGNCNVLVNGRFQAAKKRFSRKKIIDRRTVQAITSNYHDGSCDKQTDKNDTSVLLPEQYKYTIGVLLQDATSLLKSEAFHGMMPPVTD